jgi:hypothetical protein
MTFILGIITGLLIATLVCVVTLRSKTSIERTVNRVISMTNQKGNILEPTREDVQQWMNSLKVDNNQSNQ